MPSLYHTLTKGFTGFESAKCVSYELETGPTAATCDLTPAERAALYRPVQGAIFFAGRASHFASWVNPLGYPHDSKLRKRVALWTCRIVRACVCVCVCRAGEWCAPGELSGSVGGALLSGLREAARLVKILKAPPGEEPSYIELLVSTEFIC